MKDEYKDVIVYNYCKDNKCSCCGNCCGDILPLSKQDIEKIDKYLKKNKIEETPRCTLVEYDNTCPFRDNKNKKCKIYEVRPEICRVYQCNKTAYEVYKNREMTYIGKLTRSMRNLFFNDNEASYIFNIFDRKNKLIRKEVKK